MPHPYMIKDGYIHKTEALTKDQNRSTSYWNIFRLKTSKYYQYDVYKYAVKYILKERIQSVVDVGCGSAYKLVNLIFPVCNNIVGIDQKSAIEFCSKNYKVGRFYPKDLAQPGNDFSEQFDLVICSDVVEHMLDPDTLMSFISQILKPNGTVIFSTPERDILYGIDNSRAINQEHVREWNKAEFVSYVESQGYKVIESKVISSLRANMSLWYLREYFSRNLKHCHLLVAKKG